MTSNTENIYTRMRVVLQYFEALEYLSSVAQHPFISNI